MLLRQQPQKGQPWKTSNSRSSVEASTGKRFISMVHPYAGLKQWSNPHHLCCAEVRYDMPPGNLAGKVHAVRTPLMLTITKGDHPQLTGFPGYSFQQLSSMHIFLEASSRVIPRWRQKMARYYGDRSWLSTKRSFLLLQIQDEVRNEWESAYIRNLSKLTKTRLNRMVWCFVGSHFHSSREASFLF